MKNPKVDALLKEKSAQWQKELAALRAILLESPLTEEVKWGKPCYTFEGGNIAIIYGLKESCAIGFLKGVLLKDAAGILLKPGENSQSGRWVKFTSVEEIRKLAPTLKAYIHESVEAEKAGLRVEFKKSPEPVARELQDKLDKNAALKKAFTALTPGRQRAYNLFVSGAKQSETRTSRVEKCMPRILSGKGLNDCVCGQSKKFPYCDGSHQFIKK